MSSKPASSLLGSVCRQPHVDLQLCDGARWFSKVCHFLGKKKKKKRKNYLLCYLTEKNKLAMLDSNSRLKSFLVLLFILFILAMCMYASNIKTTWDSVHVHRSLSPSQTSWGPGLWKHRTWHIAGAQEQFAEWTNVPVSLYTPLMQRWKLVAFLFLFARMLVGEAKLQAMSYTLKF